MEKFVWEDKYSLGINIIDTQHKHFFDIINQIYDKLQQGGDNRADLTKVIAELVDYAYFHLATEEKYFNQFAYSDIVNHMRQHTMFREKTMEYSDRIKKAGEDLPKLALEVTDFAKNWLIKHIMYSDQLYVSFFKAHNIN